MNNITIIPDLHADLDRLKHCLGQAEGHKLAFLGDFIDAGRAVKSPDDLSVLKAVKELISDKRAIAVMGNHELNSILFHRNNRSGQPLRSHSSKNCDQHSSFLNQIGRYTPLAMQWTEWFLSLPLWIDDNGLRLVHACWDDTAINIISERRPDGRLHLEDLEEIATKETAFAKAVETLTSGLELKLPDDIHFYDGKGVPRDHVRIAWWLANGGTWRDVALSVPNIQELPNTLVDGLDGIPIYPADQPPVFVGHYKMTGAPRIDTAQVACLDYPDQYCVYHWSGETTLTSNNLRSSPLNGNVQDWR
ncbi:hypothetical protein OAC90_01220 [Planktomarina sp.]|nr:hypothetical protein [Planktomarina sp.]